VIPTAVPAPLNDLIAQARALNAERTLRALAQADQWTREPDDALQHKTQAKRYTVDPKTGACSCPDCRQHILPLRGRMADASCGSPLACKHHYCRMLLRGETVYLHDFNGGTGYAVRLAEGALLVRQLGTGATYRVRPNNVFAVAAAARA
jgi:hypothetical protein